MGCIEKNVVYNLQEKICCQLQVYKLILGNVLYSSQLMRDS
jgi:hypothetical protein